MAARRQRILASATELLTESGPDGLSMRRLADRAGVSVNTIYNLIGARDAVIAALVDQVIELIAPEVEHVGSDDPLARCVAVIDRSAALVIEHDTLTRPLAQEIFGYGGPGAGVARRWGTEALGRAIESAVSAGQLDDSVSSSALAATVYAVWANSALGWAHGTTSDDGFRTASLHALHLVLLAVATSTAQPTLRDALSTSTQRLDAVLAFETDPLTHPIN